MTISLTKKHIFVKANGESFIHL